MEGRIEPTVFQRINDDGSTSDEFGGEPVFTVTFIKREE